MNLLPCKICGGKADFCEWCGGCHLIVCSDCKASFDLAGCVPNDAETIDELRLQIAEIWNRRASPEPLTDAELVNCYLQVSDKEWAIGGMEDAKVFARAIEKAHGIGAGE